MNIAINQQTAIRNTVRPAADESGAVLSPAPATPSLDSIVRAVCLDANYDSLKFVLRSDTGHDGE